MLLQACSEKEDYFSSLKTGHSLVQIKQKRHMDHKASFNCCLKLKFNRSMNRLLVVDFTKSLIVS